MNHSAPFSVVRSTQVLSTRADSSPPIIIEELRSQVVRLEQQKQEVALTHDQQAHVLEKYRALFNHFPMPALIVDAHEHIIELNPEAASFFGSTPSDDFLDLSVQDLFEPDIHNQIRQALCLSQQSAKQILPLLTLRGPHNQTILCDIHVIHLQDESYSTRDALLVIVDHSDEMALLESESRLMAIVNTEPECIAIIDRQGCFVQMNPAGLAMIEADSQKQIIGMSVFEFVSPEYRSAFARHHQQVLNGTSSKFKYETLGFNGGSRWRETHGIPLQDHGVTVHLAVSRDITEYKEDAEKLHLAASVFTHAREGIIITSTDGTIIDVNEAFSRITGYSRTEVLGQNPHILSSERQDAAFYIHLWKSLTDKGYWSGEIWNRRKNGDLYAEILTISAVLDGHGSPRHYVALFSDITAQKTQQQQLEHIAHYDALTRLPNRVLLADRLQLAMTQTQRRGLPMAAAFLDLDNFKTINDTYGHAIGDQLLISLATRMKQTLRDGDTLSRFGGDEFVAVLPDLQDEARLPMLTRLLDVVSQPVSIGNLVLQVSASLGVSFYPQVDAIDAEQLLRQADQAMYQAKLSGKNRYHIFDTSQDSQVRWTHENIERIRLALEAQEFELYYQPKVNMCTGTIIGAEALIRWQHPDKGLLLPLDFLPLIENHPLAVTLGEWVIDTALTQIEQWEAIGLDFPISVNIGARQLQQSDFTQRLHELLAAHPQARSNRLEMEILETSALEDLKHVSAIIEACREMGVTFSLDDFGTGYSSLSYLKFLAVSQIKIDQSFVRDMLDDPDDLAILEGVIGLAGAFRRQVIAEGVETVPHGTMLLQLGCTLAQGYGIARPMPADAFQSWAATWKPDPSWFQRPAISRSALQLLLAGVECRAWIRSVVTALKDEQASLSPLIRPSCRLGEWIATDGQHQYSDQTAFHSLRLCYQNLLSTVQALQALHAQGDHQALAQYLHDLYTIQDALVEQLNTLIVL